MMELTTDIAAVQTYDPQDEPVKNTTTSKGQYVAVAQLDEMEEGEGTFVEVDGIKIALFKFEDNEVSAIGNVCPHQGAPLADGWFDDEEGVVTCPLHAWDFDVRTGMRTNGPESVPAYKVRVVDGTVEVAV